MGGLLRKLCIYICAAIYPFIVKVYAIFYNLANTRFLEGTDVINKLSANIYVLVSVVMLFAFSVTILSAIVNPDLLTDGKKGVAAAFKRAIIGLALMILIPFMFNELYALQKNVMTNSLIEKIIVGADFSCKDNDPDCEVGGNGGQVIAGTLISSVLYPDENFADENGNINVNADVADSYTKMVTENIDYIGAVKKDINAVVDGTGGSDGDALKWDFDDDAYAFHFDGLLAMVVGGVTIYILVLFSIDVAVRVFKLAFLELTAPISIVGYMAAGDKILSSWFKEVGKTFADLFVRIAALAFYLFLISNISSLFDNLGSKSGSFTYKAFFKAFLVVGMLIFAKQVPDVIGNIFGVKIESKGGIGGRLGSMAAVGKQAQKAWGAMKKFAVAGTALAMTGPAGAVAAAGAIGLGAGANQLWKKKLKDTGFGRVVSKGASAIGAGARTGASFIKANGFVSGYKDAKKTWSESDFGKERVSARQYALDKARSDDFNRKMGNVDANGDVTGRIPKGSEYTKAGIENYKGNSKKDLGTTRGEAVDKVLDTKIRKGKVDKIDADKNAVLDMLNDLRSTAKTKEAQDAISNLKNGVMTGQFSFDSFRDQLNSLVNRGIVISSDAGGISAKMDSIENKVNSDATIKEGMIKDGKIIFGNSGLGTLKSDVDSAASDAKAGYDKLYNGSSDTTKQAMDMYLDFSDQLVARSVDEAQGETKVDHKSDYSFDFSGTSPIASSSSSSSNVEHTTLQENIDRMSNVHDAPTREEHINRQSEYNDLFNSDAGSRYLDANEAEADRRSSSSSSNNTFTASAAAAGAAAGSVLGSSTVQVEGIDDLFNNLSKTITSANDSTNKILENQLNEQKNMNTELKDQTNSINNIGNKINEFKNDVNSNLDSVKKSINDSNNNSDE